MAVPSSPITLEPELQIFASGDMFRSHSSTQQPLHLLQHLSCTANTWQLKTMCTLTLYAVAVLINVWPPLALFVGVLTIHGRCPNSLPRYSPCRPVSWTTSHSFCLHVEWPVWLDSCSSVIRISRWYNIQFKMSSQFFSPDLPFAALSARIFALYWVRVLA
jgi:hypothetical protein